MHTLALFGKSVSQFSRSVSLEEPAGSADQLLQVVNKISSTIVFPFQQSGLTFAAISRHLWVDIRDPAALEHSADHRNLEALQSAAI